MVISAEALDRGLRDRDIRLGFDLDRDLERDLDLRDIRDFDLDLDVDLVGGLSTTGKISMEGDLLTLTSLLVPALSSGLDGGIRAEGEGTLKRNLVQAMKHTMYLIVSWKRVITTFADFWAGKGMGSSF